MTPKDLERAMNLRHLEPLRAEPPKPAENLDAGAWLALFLAFCGGALIAFATSGIFQP